MSRASVQSLTVLAVAAGAIKSIIEANIGSDAAPTIMYLEGRAQDVINRWPETGNPRRNLKTVERHIHNIRDELDSAVGFFSACCLSMLAQRLLLLLYEKISDDEKLMLVSELLESVSNAVDIYDPKEQDEAAAKEADRLCNLIKKEIGWIS